MPDTLNIDINPKVNSSLAEIDKLNKTAWENRSKDVTETFTLANKANTLSYAANYKKGLAESLRTLGYCYWRFSNYVTAMEKSLEAVDLFKKLNDKKGEADTVNNLGAVYMFLNDNKKRLECNLTCLQLREAVGDHEGVAGSLNNIGETYLEMRDYESAVTYFEKCLHHPNSEGTNKGWGLYNMGVVHSLKGEVETAIKYLKECLELTETIGYKTLTASALLFLGRLLLKKNLIDAAVEQLQKALNITLETRAKEDTSKIYLALSEAYEQQKEINEAYKYFKLYHTLRDEILTENNTQQLKNIEFQYEMEAVRKEAEIERIKNSELKKAYDEIEVKSNEIAEKNRAITDSINYAERIQRAMLPNVELINKLFPHSFGLFRPKDIVSGDFYWFAENNDKFIVAAIDCTGHGVPGAFMSMIGNDQLNHIVVGKGITTPGDILFHLNNEIKKGMKQKGDAETQDGMDIALCTIDIKSNTLEYAGAFRPLYLFRDGKLQEYTPDKRGIGGLTPMNSAFTNNKVPILRDDIIYIFTDGYADQFGGPNGKKFMTKNFKNLLTSIQHLSMHEQEKALEDNLNKWQGKYEQVDDILVIGIKI